MSVVCRVSGLPVMVVVGFLVVAAEGAELALDARQLLERATSRQVRLSDDGRSIELVFGALVEDDGPAAGYSYRPNEEQLSEEVRIRKRLKIADCRARRAWLLVGAGGTLQGTINGRPVTLAEPNKAGNYWQAYSIPIECLQNGMNDIVLWGRGKVWIARDDDYASGSTTRTKHPNRSAKSRDAGKTWDEQRLGVSDNCDGEYYVRLWLEQFRASGEIVTEVLDLANLRGARLASSSGKLGAVKVRVEGEADENGKIGLRLRTSNDWSESSGRWSEWQRFDGPEARLTNPEGRFLQVAVDLATTDRRHSPRLGRIVVESAAEVTEDWTAQVRIVEHDSARVVRSSIPFAYEPLKHGRLADLRKRFKLDEEVAGAKSEFELIQRLALWSSRRWNDKGHLGESYPAWDAHAILEPHRDGRPTGGFCQQHNVVFLQACESFGLNGRAVSLGPGDQGLKIRSGHEVIEIWSNEFRKWIYVDGDMAWYFADGVTGQPLSPWELRQRQLDALEGREQASSGARGTRVVHMGEPRQAWEGLLSWPPFAELRLIPRSNFLEAVAPLPLNQGMRGWFWTGHHVWTDERYSASLLYVHRETVARNWNWTLNQASVYLEAGKAPGAVRVHLDTVTPSFSKYLVTIDGKARKSVEAGFAWELHRGVNELRVFPTNQLGREGAASVIRLEWLKQLGD